MQAEYEGAGAEVQEEVATIPVQVDRSKALSFQAIPQLSSQSGHQERVPTYGHGAKLAGPLDD
jgi:hypothetical protein